MKGKDGTGNTRQDGPEGPGGPPEDLRTADLEQRYRQVMDTAEEGIWVLDRDYVTIFVNRRMAAMLLYRPKEMVGKSHHTFLFEEDSADLEEKSLMRRQGLPGRYERRLRRKDGSTLWAHVSASAILDSKGRFQGSFAMFTDITERKHAEEALKESEKKFRSIFENAVEGIFQSTPDGRLITVNPAMARMYGYRTTREMISGVSNLGQEIYTSAADRHRFKDILEKDGIIKGFEAQFHRKDGAVFWGSLNVRAVRSADRKEVLYYEGTMEDITARKRAEEALRESESKYRTLFNTTMDAIYLYEVTDAGMPGKFVEVSEVICRRLGYGREEMLSMTPRDIDGPETIADLGTMMDVLLKAGSARFETTHVARDGERIPVEVSSRILALEDRMMVLSVARDVSERKRAEARLRKSEEKYRNIFENAVEGIFQVTPDGKYLSVNPALARIHGFDSPEEMKEAVTDIAHQLYVDPSRRAVLKRRIEEEGRVRNFEIMMRRKDGSLHWISNSAHAIRDDRENILYYEGTTEDITSRKFAEEELKQLKATLEGTLRAMAATVELRDPGRRGHQERVSRLAADIALAMGFSPEMAENIRKAGLIHDIGMMSVPVEILNRPGRLTEMELNLVKGHPRSGYEIIRDAGLPHPVAETIFQHHERLDGSGYPLGLKGNEILLEARILAVADVVEAMASARPYRSAAGLGAALGEIDLKKGVLYDAGVVSACTSLLRERGVCESLGLVSP